MYVPITEHPLFMLMHVNITDLTQSWNKLLLITLSLSSTCRIC